MKEKVACTALDFISAKRIKALASFVYENADKIEMPEKEKEKVKEFSEISDKEIRKLVEDPEKCSPIFLTPVQKNFLIGTFAMLWPLLWPLRGQFVKLFEMFEEMTEKELFDEDRKYH